MSTQVQQVKSALRGKPTTGPDASLWARIGYWAGISVVQSGSKTTPPIM